MDEFLSVVGDALGALFGSYFEHKSTGKKIEWTKNFRLLAVGFWGNAILFFIIGYFGFKNGLSDAICCSSFFFIPGILFLILFLSIRINLRRIPQR